MAHWSQDAEMAHNQGLHVIFPLCHQIPLLESPFLPSVWIRSHSGQLAKH